MTANAVVAGTFADLKTVKSRSVVQMVVEIPIERGASVVEMFGFPQPGEEIAVAVARLVGSPAPAVPTPPEAQQPAASKPRAPGQKWDECKYAKQLSTACGSKDGEFRAWLSRRGGFANVLGPDAAVAEVKRILGIESRKELDADEEKASRWSRLYGQYLKHRDELIGQEQAEAQAAAYLGGRR